MRAVYLASSHPLASVVLLGLCWGSLPANVTATPTSKPAPIHQGTALFTLVNNTSQPLALYVDGQHLLSVSSRQSGIISVTTGYHTFEAVMLDGTNRHVTRSGEIDAAGRTWTVDEG